MAGSSGVQKRLLLNSINGRMGYVIPMTLFRTVHSVQRKRQKVRRASSSNSVLGNAVMYKYPTHVQIELLDQPRQYDCRPINIVYYMVVRMNFEHSKCVQLKENGGAKALPTHRWVGSESN